nr:MAG TPA: minor tail protein Z [Caudoviricetes sp.]
MIHFQIEMQDLTKIEAALGMTRDKSKIVLRSAINNAAKQIEKTMVKETKGRYVFKRDIKSANSVKKATTRNMQAIITVRGTANELYDFQVRPQTYYPGSKGAPSWIKARGKKSGKLQRIAARMGTGGDQYKGFVVKYHSGHLAFAERVPGKKMRSDPKKEAIETLYSLATPKMEEVVYMDEIHEGVMDLLEKSIETQIYRYMR